MCVVETTEVQTDLISLKALVKSTEQKIVLVRALNLSGHEKVISKNTDVGKCASVETVINNEQPPEPAEMSAKDQKELNENVEKLVGGLGAPERNKAKRLLKRYAYAFATSNRRQGRTGMIKHEIDTDESRPIKQAPRTIPLAKRNEVKELVEEMKRSYVIDPSPGRGAHL